jgi:hypothetical protein
MYAKGISFRPKFCFGRPQAIGSLFEVSCCNQMTKHSIEIGLAHDFPTRNGNLELPVYLSKAKQ